MKRFFKIIVLGIFVILTCSACGLSKKPVKEVFELQSYTEDPYINDVRELEKNLDQIQAEQASHQPASDALISETNTKLNALSQNSISGRIYIEHHKAHLETLNLIQDSLAKQTSGVSKLSWPQNLNLSADINNSIQKLDMLDNWVMNVVDSYQKGEFATDNHQLDFKQYFDSLNKDVQKYYMTSHFATFKQVNCIQSLVSTMNEERRKGQAGLNVELPLACKNINAIFNVENLYASDPIVRFKAEKLHRTFEADLKKLINQPQTSYSTSAFNEQIRNFELMPGGALYIQSFSAIFEALNSKNTGIVYGTLSADAQQKTMEDGAQKRIDDFDRAMIGYYEQSLRPETELSKKLLSAKLHVFEKAYYALLLYPGGPYHYIDPKRLEVMTDIAKLNAFESIESFFPWDEEYLNQKAALKDTPNAYPAHQLKIEVEKRKYASLVKRFSKATGSDELLTDSLLLSMRYSIHEMERIPGGNAFMNEQNVELLNRKLASKAAKIIYLRNDNDAEINKTLSTQITALGKSLDRYISLFYMQFSPYDMVSHEAVLKLYSNMLSQPGGLEAIFVRKNAVEYLNELAYLWLAYLESANTGDAESVVILTNSFLKKYPEMNGIPSFKMNKKIESNAEKQAKEIENFLNSSTNFSQLTADEFNEKWESSIATLVNFDYMIRNKAQMLSLLLEKSTLVKHEAGNNKSKEALNEEAANKARKAALLNKIVASSLHEETNICDDYNAQYKDYFETVRWLDSEIDALQNSSTYHQDLSEKYDKAGDSRNASSERQKSRHDSNTMNTRSRDLLNIQEKIPALQKEAKQNNCTLDEI